MKMSGRFVLRCAVLLLCLASVSAIKKLHSINDLKKVDFDRAVPKHTLILLYWFANEIDIDNNDVIHLTFDPNREQFGSHHYGNYERMLNPLPQGNIRYRYYTVGNLNHRLANSELPEYVLNPERRYRGGNRDRIIFRVREQASEIIDEVYITQHYENSNEGTRYDPAHTYQITTNLLRQIREFSGEEGTSNSVRNLKEDFGSNIDNTQIRSLISKWADLACLGLLLFIILEEKYFPININRGAKRMSGHCVVNISSSDQNHHDGQVPRELFDEENIQLEVTTGTNGKARIHWQGVSEARLQQRVMLLLFKDNEGQTALYSKQIGSDSGNMDTSVLLNTGLQARLHKTRTKYCCWTVVAEEICRGSEFRNPEKVQLQDYDASLQLFVKDGKACARLFVGKAFRDWRSVFVKSWVGFYTDANKATDEYGWWKWQWATKFQKSTPLDPYHNVYEYHSGMAISPGVQARFIISNYSVVAQTSWR
ncbi:uncharacterized protein LOC133541574 [Nerophis ophidion]|uniref:uncharacterized protein LOC133541574 n=1 Tax=Nerophis ophidion TaxID=159077 RepID=UPI002ADF0FB2|nr:uncharacterized protein LOC133541574 [Nerophis ophidion]XP_061741037.1 uncharacterized protein LOC133541574 [Nerophis ophidion]